MNPCILPFTDCSYRTEAGCENLHTCPENSDAMCFSVPTRLRHAMIRRATLVVPACLWQHDDHSDYWETSCGEAFFVTEGTPADNSMRFCPYCGARITPPEENK